MDPEDSLLACGTRWPPDAVIGLVGGELVPPFDNGDFTEGICFKFEELPVDLSRGGEGAFSSGMAVRLTNPLVKSTDVVLCCRLP
jgi:hypothetical protein